MIGSFLRSGIEAIRSEDSKNDQIIIHTHEQLLNHEDTTDAESFHEKEPCKSFCQILKMLFKS